MIGIRLPIKLYSFVESFRDTIRLVSLFLENSPDIVGNVPDMLWSTNFIISICRIHTSIIYWVVTYAKGHSVPFEEIWISGNSSMKQSWQVENENFSEESRSIQSFVWRQTSTLGRIKRGLQRIFENGPQFDRRLGSISKLSWLLSNLTWLKSWSWKFSMTPQFKLEKIGIKNSQVFDLTLNIREDLTRWNSLRNHDFLWKPQIQL